MFRGRRRHSVAMAYEMVSEAPEDAGLDRHRGNVVRLLRAAS